MIFKEEIKKLIFSKTFLLVLLLKIISGTLFASHYLTDYFSPFIKYFVESGFKDPWEYFYSIGRIKAFPYPTGMLLILSLPRYLISFFMTSTPWSEVGFMDLFLMRLPILFADITIFVLLAKWFQDNFKKVLWLYWCSPILFYINYYHGQLDVIPTALFLLSIHFLFSKEYISSSIILSLGLAAKGHLLIVVPFYLIYCWKQKLSYKDITLLFFIITGGYIALVSPVILTEGYKHLVVMASEQSNLFVLKIPFDLNKHEINMLIAPAVLFVLFMRFSAYEKLNRDIMILYFAMVFSVLVVLVPPMPGWYYWGYPLLVYFFIRRQKVSILPLVILNILYLLYFLTYERTDLFEAWKVLKASFPSLKFSAEILEICKLRNKVISDFIFTLLQTSVVVIVYWIYREGIMSNELYKPKKKPIMIGIGGDSGAGKDTLVNCYKNILGENNCIVLSGDDYHKWPRKHQEWKIYTHINAYGNKLHDQLKDAIALKDGKSVMKVTYDHETGDFTNPQTVDPNKIVFFVGLHTFYIEQMRSLYDIKIYLEPDENLRKYWKVNRDTKERKYTISKAKEQIKEREKDSTKFIQPQRQFADMVIQFLPEYEIDFKDAGSGKEIDLKLKVSINNSIYLEYLIQELKEISTLSVNFWHEDDLKNQTLEIKGNISGKETGNIANKIIPNLFELITNDEWMENYFGVLQLLFLVHLSHVLKCKNDEISFS